jgi:hypothetical protein
MKLHLYLQRLDFLEEFLIFLELDGEILGLIFYLIFVLLVLNDEKSLLLFYVTRSIPLEKPRRSLLLSSIIFFLSSTICSSTL